MFVQELKSGVVPLLIPTPNATNEIGYNRDRFLLNPSLTGEEHLRTFRFLGILLGVAVRTKKPLDLYLAAPVWKQLAGMALTSDDLEEVFVVCILAYKRRIVCQILILCVGQAKRYVCVQSKAVCGDNKWPLTSWCVCRTACMHAVQRCKKKVKERIVLREIHLRTTGRHLSMGSHSVICHPTEVTAPPSPQPGGWGEPQCNFTPADKIGQLQYAGFI